MAGVLAAEERLDEATELAAGYNLAGDVEAADRLQGVLVELDAFLNADHRGVGVNLKIGNDGFGLRGA